ncbi:hypothetical protein RND81_10G089100 [Saponaria officinalis]|uniref:Uncharacterized protein n=1 Tax=Saponaria officinalis TaxID=3572 RepID=A0AAW1I0S3_SAPOF
MLSSWDKVRSFLETMDVRDVHSPYPFSSTFSSSSSNSDSVGHPSFVGTRSWLVGDETIKQILSVIQPTMDSENRRKEIIEFLQQLIGGALGIKVFVCGSVPLKTYLPHGDVDLTAVSNFGSSQELAADICGLLEYEKQNGAALPVRDVFSVPAQVRVVKCTVGNIAVDISFNQTAGLCALYFLDQVDQFVGKDHLFKLSIILIKAWCYYESRLLGSFYGLISTYGLEIMVLHVINLFHSSLHCPLAVLHKFLEYYSTFDWTLYCVAINGLVLLSSLPKIEVLSSNCDGLLLTEDFLRCTRDPLLPSTGVVGNFFRIRSALSYGAEKLREVLMLPPEKIGGGLEKFFKTTLERNGQGKRADVLFPVPVYGSESLKNVNTDLLTGIHYGMWFNEYDYPVRPAMPTPGQMWYNGWGDMSQNIPCEQFAYCYAEESQPFDGPRVIVNHPVVENLRMRGMVSSFDNPGFAWQNNPRTICGNNAGSFEENWNSRGTASSVDYRGGPQINDDTSVEGMWKSREFYPFIPSYDRPMQEVPIFEDNGKEHEKKKEEESGNLASQSGALIGSNIASDVGESSSLAKYSMDEFPVLPASKPIPIRPSPLACAQGDQVKETSESSDSTEFGSCKLASPTSLSLSEAGKQSDSDGSIFLDALSEPTDAVVIPKDKSPSESQEKMVVPVPALQLTDESEFPPLSRPERPVITLSKKEFPPLRACLRSQKRSKGRR